MRRFILTALLSCASSVSYAAPDFRPLDTSMQIAPAASTTVTAQTMTAPAAGMQPRGVARNGEVIESQGSNAIPALPLELMTANGVSYLSGGIGDEEKAQLKAQENQFNVRILVTEANGEYRGGARLALRNDTSGDALLNLDEAGPYIYMVLPKGNYTLQVASSDGNAKTLKLKIGEGTVVKEQIRL